MIYFPNAKINIGLNVLEKREDGYHNIESVFYPVSLCDALEAIPIEGFRTINLSTSGNSVPGSPDTNLCVKAYNLLNTKFKLPSVNLGLLKHIPIGGGLGGGSSDAAFFLKILNELFSLNISNADLKTFASQIGSDCTFFIDNTPSLVTGTGNILSPIEINLDNYFISIVCPAVHIETKNAYSLIIPSKNRTSLKQVIFETSIKTWKEALFNDFEKPIFNLYPELAEIKNRLYEAGAIYASMTGSGAALYGIFDKKPYLADMLPACKIWTIPPKKVL